MTEVQDSMEDLDRKLKKQINEVRDNLESQEASLTKQSSTLKELESRLALTDAKLVTDK